MWREAKLDPNWWMKYDFKDVPIQFKNPHLESVWYKGSDQARMVGKMACGMAKELNPRIRQRKADILRESLKSVGIYMPNVPFNLRNFNIYVAAVMEAFTNTGIYDRQWRIE